MLLLLLLVVLLHLLAKSLTNEQNASATITGIQSQPALNGKMCVVEKFKNGRYSVRVGAIVGTYFSTHKRVRIKQLNMLLPDTQIKITPANAPPFPRVCLAGYVHHRDSDPERIGLDLCSPEDLKESEKGLKLQFAPGDDMNLLGNNNKKNASLLARALVL